MARARIYLGTTIVNGERRDEIFKSPETPTFASHGDRYTTVTGPFRTMRSALFMRDYGQGNPHCRCVAEAELLAVRYRSMPLQGQ